MENVWDQIRALEKGWDSYGGNPISEDVINTAQWIQLFFKNTGLNEPHPIPGPDGSITFEWDKAMLTIESDLSISIYTEFKSELVQAAWEKTWKAIAD
jgi:hypothetical protein